MYRTQFNPKLGGVQNPIMRRCLFLSVFTVFSGGRGIMAGGVSIYIYIYMYILIFNNYTNVRACGCVCVYVFVFMCVCEGVRMCACEGVCV